MLIYLAYLYDYTLRYKWTVHRNLSSITTDSNSVIPIMLIVIKKILDTELLHSFLIVSSQISEFNSYCMNQTTLQNMYR